MYDVINQVGQCMTSSITLVNTSSAVVKPGIACVFMCLCVSLFVCTRMFVCARMFMRLKYITQALILSQQEEASEVAALHADEELEALPPPPTPLLLAPQSHTALNAMSFPLTYRTGMSND